MSDSAKNPESLKSKALKASGWAAGLQFGSQIGGFLISLVLARLLAPADFGLAAIVAVLTMIGSSVADGGFSTAIVQKESLDNADCSTAFWFNLVASSGMIALAWLAAPLIADFYGDVRLVPLIYAASLGMLLRAAVSCQRARLTRSLDFRMLLACELPGVIAGACVGIPMAYMGYGVWSLIGQGLTGGVVTGAVIWFRSGWVPGWVFRRDSFKSMFSYGSKMALAQLGDQIFRNLYVLIIARLFPLTEVGFYNRAQNLQQLVASNVFGVVDQVMFPLLSSVQNDPERMRRGFDLSLSVISLVTFPVFTGLGVLAPSIIPFLFGERWLPSAPYLQILCGVGVLWPLHAANLSILRAKGASGQFLVLEIVKKILIVISILLTFRSGVAAMLWGQLACSGISLIINTHYNHKLIGTSLWSQLLTMAPFALVASVMGIGVTVLKSSWGSGIWWALPAYIAMGALLYVIGMKALQLKCNRELAGQFKGVPVLGRLSGWLLA